MKRRRTEKVAVSLASCRPRTGLSGRLRLCAFCRALPASGAENHGGLAMLK